MSLKICDKHAPEICFSFCDGDGFENECPACKLVERLKEENLELDEAYTKIAALEETLVTNNIEFAKALKSK